MIKWMSRSRVNNLEMSSCFNVLPIPLSFRLFLKLDIRKGCVSDEGIDEDFEEEIMLDVGEVNTSSQDIIEVTCQDNSLYFLPYHPLHY